LDRLSVGSEYRPVTVTSGAFVVGIEPASPAYSAGIRAGDVILSFDEKTVDSPTALSEAIREQSPESRVVVSWIDANGQYRRATVRFNNGPT
jgi:S1-C subfamily serine protease